MVDGCCSFESDQISSFRIGFDKLILDMRLAAGRIKLEETSPHIHTRQCTELSWVYIVIYADVSYTFFLTSTAMGF